MPPKTGPKQAMPPKADPDRGSPWMTALAVAIAAQVVSGAIYLYMKVGGGGLDNVLPPPSTIQAIRPRGLLCSRTNDPLFTEDIKYDYERGIAFLSADKNRGQYNTVMGRWNLTAGAVGKGDLWYFDVAKDWDVRPLEPEGFDLQGNDFHPLGIAFSARKGTPMYFYAINHRRAGGTVEIFSLRFREDDLDYTVPSIKWIRTVKHPLVNTPNSLLPVEQSNGKLHYYVTNDHYFHAIDGIYAKLKFAENALRLPLASVALCSVDPIPVASPTEGVECRIVAPNLRFANGIGMSNDGRTVFVAQTLGFSLSSYDRDPHTNSLTFKGSTPLGYAVDNVEVDEGDGSVIVAGHPDPVLVKWVAGGVGDPEERDAYRAGFRAPSRVVRVVPSAEAAPKDWKVSTLFEDSGEYFGSSSTGVMDSVRNLFLASGLYDIGVLVCRKAA